MMGKKKTAKMRGGGKVKKTAKMRGGGKVRMLKKELQLVILQDLNLRINIS